MKLLLDTCEMLFLLTNDRKLTAPRRAAIQDPNNLVFLSSVSATEIAIKYSIGKLPLPEPPEIYIPRNRILHQISELPLNEKAALLVSNLPWHHKDPFDRLLIAQALADELILVSSDPLIRKYPVKLL